MIQLTDAPGLGATVDPDAIKRYHVQGAERSRA
jgi:L-alanine-DL-glutamate epimerase-like enolase superfamily enzyme